MQVLQVVAPVFGTNCCLVIAGSPPAGGPPDADPRRDCVVVDAGSGVAHEVSRLVAEHGLRPRAVLATHGHADHTWDAATLCERYDVPLRIHAADAYRLADPFGTLGLGGELAAAGVSDALTAALAAAGRRPGDYRTPRDVETFAGAGSAPVELVAGDVRLSAVPAPGHTEGSTLFVPDSGAQATGDPGAATGVVLAGDVLFAGGVGRTDLPGGDPRTMARTLRDVVARLDPRLAVVPGHGPTTTVGRELATNPFLRQAMDRTVG